MNSPTPSPLSRFAEIRQKIPRVVGMLVVLAVAVVAGRWTRSGSLHVDGRGSPDLTRATTPAPHVDRGEIVFQVHCAKCHGPDGHGDPDAMVRQKPPPRDFASRPWRFQVDPDTIRRVTVEGIPGSAMPSFRSALSSSELDSLVAHTYRLATTGPITVQESSPLAAVLSRAGFVPESEHRLASALSLSDAAGQTRTLAAERGRTVLLNFWGQSCGHCIAGMPKLQALAQRWEPHGLTVLHICADAEDAPSAQQIADRVSPETHVWIDETGLANSLYDVHVLPTIWLIGPDGHLLGSARGMQDWTGFAIEEMLRQLCTAGQHSGVGVE